MKKGGESSIGIVAGAGSAVVIVTSVSMTVGPS